MVIDPAMDVNIETTQPKYNSCFYSSFIFLVNSIVAFFFGYMFYSIIFFILVITSLIVHSTGNIYARIIDKIAILLIVLYGGYLFYTKCLRPIDIKQIVYIISIVSTFLITVYLYYFGYLQCQYCFCEDKQIANQYHSFLHFVSSIGHVLIVLM
jgi:hypothetical protein